MRMKQLGFRLIRTAIAALLAVALVSCEVETSDNGRLDGFWHLERVDTLATGNSADYSGRHVFWGTQLHLIAVRNTESIKDGYYLRFRQTADSLVVTAVFENKWHEDADGSVDGTGGDIPVLEPDGDLRFLGINDIPEGFAKERLDGKFMVLRSRTLRLSFRKF